MKRFTSVSDEQLRQYADTVLNHPARAEVEERIVFAMMSKFRNGNPAVREEINAIMDKDIAFLEEVAVILDELSEVNVSEDEQE